MDKQPYAGVDHIGIVVKDLERAMEHYSSLGIGPFEPLGAALTERIVRGKPATNVKNKVKVAMIGKVQLEIIQPVEGESLQKEFLAKRGEGLHHLGFLVDDIEAEIGKLAKQKVPILSSGKFQGGGGFVLFDTLQEGGMVFELVQWPAKK